MRWTTLGAVLLVLLAFSALAQSVSAERAVIEETPIAEQMIGGDKDEYGCIATAGYLWSREKQACIRPWLENNGLIESGVIGQNTVLSGEAVITPARTRTGAETSAIAENSAVRAEQSIAFAFSEIKARKSNNPLQVIANIVTALQNFFAQFV